MRSPVDRERFRPAPSVRTSISADGLVLLDARGGLVLSSNAIGACIWSLLADGRTPQEIAERLAADYAIAHERAARDVAAFVRDLAARGLVCVEGEA